MTTPRHVALLSTDFRPMVGGVADHLHRLADAMAARLPVTVLTSAPQDGAAWTHAYQLETLPPLPERRLSAAIGDGFAPMRKLWTGAHFFRLREYGIRTITRVTGQWNHEAAVVIGIWDMAAHFWCAACRRAGVPYHLFVHGAEVVMPLYGGRVPQWRATDFREASRVIANSTATAQLAAERFQLPVAPVVVNPSVGPRPSAQATTRRSNELREKFGLKNGLTIFSLGRLVPRKGFDLALRAAAAVADEFPGLAYLIAGDGPERGRLESLAGELGFADRVHFLGSVDDLTKWAAYDVCDAFVMPNRLLGGNDWEGFGIVFLEAALSGRPSIAGRTGGARDAVVDEVTGLLIDPESPIALRNALRRLLKDRPLRDQLGRAGLERAAAQFTPAAAAERLRHEAGWI
jgi:phosphatidylinositol alpha-1,6-mannosyltransferase